MNKTKRLLPLMLAALVLVSCKASSETTTTKNNFGDWDDDPVQLTELRTPTPTLPVGEIGSGSPDTPDTPGGEQGNQQNEMGSGAELEGYHQLLSYIDQSSISGPDGWGSHRADDILDGLFENTDNGSNKYGFNASQVDVTWKMICPVKISAYAIYTANDTDQYPERSPRSWTLYGSTDGENWQEIHVEDDAELPTTNYTPTLFEFENETSYRYYRWSLRATGTSDAFQLSELLLYSKEEPPKVQEGGGTVPDGLPAMGAAASGVDASPLIDTEAQAWIDDHTVLTDLVSFDSIAASVKGYADLENVDRLFDGVYTAEDFETAGYGKYCGPVTQGYVYWEMTEAVNPVGYVLVTGNDTAKFPDRNPISWVLYGATEDGEWVALDTVQNGNLQPTDFSAHVYTLDSAESYTRFCLAIEATGGGAMQLCELILCE